MSSMNYLDFDKFKAIDVAGFRGASPYPWINPTGLLTDVGYECLLDNMPDTSLFEKKFGDERIAGQMPHDRYALEYAPGSSVPKPWHEFIAELCSDDYRLTLAKLFGARNINMRFHWHYTPRGCPVSPHTDSVRELGSQLFYFNREKEWDPAWGGDTLVLDDGGEHAPKSAPSLDDFKNEIAADSVGNKSLIFARTPRSWHAVRENSCPEGQLRRVFIVVANPDNLYRTVRDRVMRKQIHRF